LYVVDVVSGEEQPEEAVPVESEATIGGELVQNEDERIMVKRRRPQYFDKRQQLDLILEAQELTEFGDHKLGPTESDEENQGVGAKYIDIWEDVVCLELLKDGLLPDAVELEESKRARKRAINYCWKEQKLYFKGLLVPRPEERRSLVSQMHEDLGHFGE
jgi:hypothetical protein